MVRFILAALLMSGAALAQDEDAAHRADRLRTQQLNRAAHAAVDHRDHANHVLRERHDDAQDRYRRQLAEWRRRVAACEAGQYDACDRR